MVLSLCARPSLRSVLRVPRPADDTCCAHVHIPVNGGTRWVNQRGPCEHVHTDCGATVAYRRTHVAPKVPALLVTRAAVARVGGNAAVG